MNPWTNRLKAFGQALLFVLVCQLAGASGALLTETGDGSWYQMLDKPAFTPPGWLFGPVWVLLYTLMGVAAYLVWRQGWQRHVVRIALGVFAAQLLLNALWTPVFFAAHWLGVAFVVIVLLAAAIALTMVRFFPLSRAAAWLLAPYLAWVVFAAVLNGSIWWING